ncbi:MAG: response regulator transcription factor [Gemmatimonadales bacterium]
MRLLLVEDDELLAGLLSRELGREGLLVSPVSSVAGARRQIDSGRFELTVIDWHLPDGSGLDVVTCYRANGQVGGAILITAGATVDDRVAGLEAGADDILAKPFEIRELRARVRTLLRRSSPWERERYTVGNLVIDGERCCLTVNGKSTSLTSKEWALARVLASQPNRAVSRTELTGMAWDDNHSPDHTLEVHLSNLRGKLAALGPSVSIASRRGLGYQFIIDPTKGGPDQGGAEPNRIAAPIGRARP